MKSAALRFSTPLFVPPTYMLGVNKPARVPQNFSVREASVPNQMAPPYTNYIHDSGGKSQPQLGSILHKDKVYLSPCDFKSAYSTVSKRMITQEKCRVNPRRAKTGDGRMDLGS